MMPSSVIIGKGKVGTATGIRINPEPDYHDPHKNIFCNDLLSKDIAIVCTDTTAKSPSDYDDLEAALEPLRNFSGIVLIRSTVAPEKTKVWESAYSIQIVIFPEFLKQSEIGLDTREPWATILGGTLENTKIAKEFLINSGYCIDESSYYLCGHEEASLIKLADNAFLSTKVTFFNSIYDICTRYGYDYEVVRAGMLMDSRVGESHTNVPGPDDNLVGFGGHCLPKDLAVIAEIDKLGLFLSIKKINDHLRNIA
jgi:UDPglucose 6-dehydrogenase